jgi:transcriptional regulator with XRE-family HTH domain
MNRDEADQIVRQVIEAGAALGLREKDILSRAGLGKTTLSKIKSSHDARISTLSRMANAVGLRLTLAPKNPTLNQLLNRELFSKESAVRP